VPSATGTLGTRAGDRALASTNEVSSPAPAPAAAKIETIPQITKISLHRA
jgi:hypothetical protein